LGSGEINVSSSDPDALPPSSGTIPSWRPRGNTVPTIRYAPGETLGPSGPSSNAVSTVLPFLKELLGTMCFGVLGARWAKDGGHIHCGSSLFRHFTITFISFPFGYGYVVAPTFLFCFKLLYQCDCYINKIIGRKSISRREYIYNQEWRFLASEHH
jgi:hypothetical protein